MFLAFIAGPAFAITCEDVMGLVNGGVATDLVVATIAAAAPGPSAADVNCLIKHDAPVAVVQAARAAEAVEQPVAATAAAPACGGHNVHVTTTGLTADFVAVFTDRASAFAAYLMQRCSTIGASSGFDIVASFDGATLSMIVVDPAFTPTSSSFAAGQRMGLNGIAMYRPTALAAALMGWTWGSVMHRAGDDGLRRAVVAAQYAVLYRRPDVKQSLLFGFTDVQGLMYPQRTVVLYAGTKTMSFETSANWSLSPNDYFPVAAPSVPDLGGRLPGTDAVYRFFDVPVPQ